MDKHIKNGARILSGGMLAIMGIAIAGLLISLAFEVTWQEVGYKDIASYAFSTAFALAMAGAGIMIAINPRIKGVRVW